MQSLRWVRERLDGRAAAREKNLNTYGGSEGCPGRGGACVYVHVRVSKRRSGGAIDGARREARDVGVRDEAGAARGADDTARVCVGEAGISHLRESGGSGAHRSSRA